MHIYLLHTLRLLEAVVAFACFYIAFLLYEDQEQQVQDKLVDVWNWIRDDRADPSYANRYMRACARLTDQAMSRIFGSRLISMHSVGVSLSYSVASYLLVMFVPQYHFEMIVWTAGCLVSGTLAASFPNRWTSLLALTVPVSVVVQRIAALANLPADFEHRLASSSSFVTGILIAAALDFWWIGLNRRFINRAVTRHWTLPMAAALLISAAIFVSVFLPFTRDPFADSTYSSNFNYNLALCLAIILSTRVFSALVAGVFFLSMILLLLYLLFGGLFARLVYAAERFSLIRARKSLALLGVALVRCAATDSGGLQWVSDAISFVAKIAGA